MRLFKPPWYLLLALAFSLFRPNLPEVRAQASQQAVSWTDTFSSATAGPDHSQFPTPTSGNPITSWIVWYYTNGAPSSVSIQIEGAADSGGSASGSYTALTAATTPVASANPATGTSEGIIRACCDYYPHIRINVTTLSGGTSPTVTVRVFGYYGTTQVAGGGGGGGGGGGTGNAASIVTYTPASSVTLTCPSSTAGTVTIFDPDGTALSGNMALTFASCTPGQIVVVRVIQAASGGPYTVSGLPSGSPQISPYPSTTTIYLLHAATSSTVAFDNVAGDSGPGVVTEISAPGTAPPSGDGYAYGDSSNHVLAYENHSGTVSVTTVPQTCTSNEAFTALSAAGAYTCGAISGAPSGSAGGDLGGSYPNPTVANLSNVTNASLANAGLANPSTTVNGATCTLGSTCSPSTHGIAASSPSLDLICAKGNDTTVAQLTITGATNAAPVVFTVSASPITNGYLVGQSFTVTGVSPSAYNGSYTVGSLTGTTITATNGGAPGQAYSSGGTVYMPCNNSSDGTSATSFSTTASIPGGTFGASTELHADALVQSFNASTTIQMSYWPVLTYNSTTIYTGAVTNPATTLPAAAPDSTAALTGIGVAAAWPFLVFSPAAGTLYAGLPTGNNSVLFNGTVPQVVTTSGTANMVPGVTLTKQGVASGTYTSGGSITGSATQTCTLTTFTGMTGTTATVPLTGTNTIAGGTALTITATGYANPTVAAPTSATLSNGTATCSGTPTISTTLGGAQGMAMRLLAFRVWQ